MFTGTIDECDTFDETEPNNGRVAESRELCDGERRAVWYATEVPLPASS